MYFFIHRSSVRQLPVVGGPLLSDADSVLLDLVFGLEGTSDLRESMPNLLDH